MKRILVIGSPGAGKSAFAIRLAAITGLPLTHLDEEYWQPDCTRRHTPQEWRATVESLVNEERWIVDGNYPSTLELRASRADCVVVLTTPRLLCLWRALTRIAFKRRPDGSVLGREPISRGFLRSIWNGPRQTAKEIEAIQALLGPTIVILRNDREAEAYLRSLKTT